MCGGCCLRCLYNCVTFSVGEVKLPYIVNAVRYFYLTHSCFLICNLYVTTGTMPNTIGNLTSLTSFGTMHSYLSGG